MTRDTGNGKPDLPKPDIRHVDSFLAGLEVSDGEAGSIEDFYLDYVDRVSSSFLPPVEIAVFIRRFQEAGIRRTADKKRFMGLRRK